MHCRNNWMVGALAAAGMAILILDSRTAVSGAKAGIDLCILTVIPSMFPFLFLSNLIMKSSTKCEWHFLKLCTKIFGIPHGMETAMIPAFLGGYPSGAVCIASAYSTGVSSADTAARMLAYCSQAGPAFLFGMISSQFNQAYAVWLLWGIQFMSAWMVSSFFHAEQKNVKTQDLPTPEENALERSLHTIGIICGWIILFRVVIEFLQRWIMWYVPLPVQVLLSGILELSNGCSMLRRIPDGDIRFIICSGMLSFGGLCVLFQTKSVVHPLPIRYYMMGKTLQALFAMTIAWAITSKQYIHIVSALVVSYSLKKVFSLSRHAPSDTLLQKSSSILRKKGV